MSENRSDLISLSLVVALSDELKRERQMVKDVVARVNRYLDAKKKNYHIQIVKKDKKTSIIGNAKENSAITSTMLNADIFIGGVRTKFDVSKSKVIHRGGFLYLPGGKSDFETAISIREKTNGARPVILIYQKIGRSRKPFRVTTEEEIIQYGEVLAFLRQIKSYTSYLESYKKFTGREFQHLLYRDLIELCSKNEEQWIYRKRISTLANTIGLDSEKKWFSNSPLKFNPFDDRLIEKIPVEEYAVGSCSLSDARRLVGDKDIVYVFGEQGSGKTTLLKNTIRSIEKRKYEDVIGTDKIYCLQIDSAHLMKQLENTGGISGYMYHHFPQLIYELISADLRFRNSNHISKSNIDFNKPASALLEIITWLNRNQYTCLLCTVDGIDEIYQIGQSDSPKLHAVHLLRNMVITNIKNFRLRFFLNSELKSLISNENKVFQLNRFHSINLAWKNEMLRDMINQRLQVASRTGSEIKLSELCPENPAIEVDMADCAGGNPKAMIWLARKLFEVHLQQPLVTEFIRAESWFTVKDEWEKVKEHYIQSNRKKGFWVDNDFIFFKETEYSFSPILSDLLTYLINAKGAICTKEELIRYTYRSENIVPLLKTFYEQIGNLKAQLDEIAPGWLQNVRGKGYRLRDPNYGFGDRQQ